MGTVSFRDMINDTKYTEQYIINYIDKYPLKFEIPAHTNDYLRTELVYACLKGYKDLAMYILSTIEICLLGNRLKTYITYCDQFNDTAFNLACNHRLESVALKILDLLNGDYQSLCKADIDGNTGLMYACDNSLLELTNKLLDVLPITIWQYRKDTYHRDALMMSAQNNIMISISRRILKTYTNQQLMTDNYGLILLNRCINNTEFAKDLIDLLPKIEVFKSIFPNRDNIFLIACRINVDIADYIYQRNTDISPNYYFAIGQYKNNALFMLFNPLITSWYHQSYDKSGDTLMKKTALANNLLGLLQEQDFHLLEHTDTANRTILIHLIHNNLTDLTDRLLKCLLSFNIKEEHRLLKYLCHQDDEGNTALIKACIYNEESNRVLERIYGKQPLKQSSIAISLINMCKNRKHLYVCNKQGLSAMDYACEYKLFDVIQAILEAFQDIHLIFQISPIHRYQFSGVCDRFKYINTNDDMINYIKHLYVLKLQPIINQYPFFDVSKMDTATCRQFFYTHREQLYNWLYNEVEPALQKLRFKRPRTTDDTHTHDKQDIHILCNICSIERSSVVLIPCGHICICSTCSNNNVDLLICPYCHNSITNRCQIHNN